MARPRVARGGNGLQAQAWRIATNIFNKHSLTAEKGWFCSLEFWRGRYQLRPY
jgi:hypothetical protein